MRKTGGKYMTVNTLAAVSKAMKITSAAANILRIAAIAFAVCKIIKTAGTLLNS